MDDVKSDMNNLAKLGIQETAIPQQKQYYGLPFPLVIQPAEHKTIEEWCSTVQKNTTFFQQLVRKYGAVLFKGFPVINPEWYDRFSGKLHSHIFMKHIHTL